MASKTRLALGFAAVAVVDLALGAVALEFLGGVGHDPPERVIVAGLLAIALGGIGWLALASLRAVDDDPAPAAPASTPATAATAPPSVPDERAPLVAARNPYRDRRGPNRAANVVRPAFGQPAGGQATASPKSPERSDDWEAY